MKMDPAATGAKVRKTTAAGESLRTTRTDGKNVFLASCPVSHQRRLRLLWFNFASLANVAVKPRLFLDSRNENGAQKCAKLPLLENLSGLLEPMGKSISLASCPVSHERRYCGCFRLTLRP